MKFLRCAIEVESGHNSNLPEVCDLARAAGRDADALQLQARAEIAAGNCREAEKKLAKIDSKDYFDLAVEMRMLELKPTDDNIKGDPIEFAKAKKRHEQILVKTVSSVEGGRL